MKFFCQAAVEPGRPSLPTWGEWVEIAKQRLNAEQGQSLPTWGEWVEIEFGYDTDSRTAGLSPHGESGLKSCVKNSINMIYLVLIGILIMGGNHHEYGTKNTVWLRELLYRV